MTDDTTPNGWNPLETLFAFMGWLTSRREESGPFSGHHEASSAVALVKQFAERHQLADVREGWDKRIVVPPPRVVDLDDVKLRLSDVCFGYRWTDVLSLTDEIERLRALVEHHGNAAVHHIAEALPPNITNDRRAGSTPLHGRPLDDNGAIAFADQPHGMGVKVAPRQPPSPVVDPVRPAAPDYRELLERARPYVAECIHLSHEVRAPNFLMKDTLAAIDAALKERP